MSALPSTLLRSFRPASWLVTGLLVLGGLAGPAPLRAQTFTEADVEASFDAHAKAFYRTDDRGAWFKETTEGGKTSFWMRAEQMEMVLDAYERSKKPEHLAMFEKLFHGFNADHGKDWLHNPFNDDIMWMVIACARAHLLTKDPQYLKAAKDNFDPCYARSLSPELGGGLWWKTDRRSKNACVNSPAAIAACLLAKATGDASYQEKAKGLYQWVRATLFDTTSGRVMDNINVHGRLGRAAFTYNQGTFVAAATMLGHPDDARLAARFTMEQMSRDGYLPPAGEAGDGAGFNGIAARWIAYFMREHQEHATFEPWLQKNAAAAWAARRASDQLIWCRFPQPTPEGSRTSWSCSSAVVLLQVTKPPVAPASAPAPSVPPSAPPAPTPAPAAPASPAPAAPAQ